MTTDPRVRAAAVALLPCPFCGSQKVAVVKRDVEPQGDPYYGSKVERFVECDDCAATLFNRWWHDGFHTEDEAIAAWNTRAALAAADGAGWRPISELPSGDGFWSVWLPVEHLGCHVHTMSVQNKMRVIAGLFLWDLESAPTMFRPLPAPPKEPGDA